MTIELKTLAQTTCDEGMARGGETRKQPSPEISVGQLVERVLQPEVGKQGEI